MHAGHVKFTPILFMHCVHSQWSHEQHKLIFEPTAGTSYMLMHCILHISQFSCCSGFAAPARLKSQPYTNNLVAGIASMQSTASPGFQQKSNIKARCMHQLICCKDKTCLSPKPQCSNVLNKNRLGHHCRSLSPHLSGILLCSPLSQHLGTQAWPGFRAGNLG